MNRENIKPVEHDPSVVSARLEETDRMQEKLLDFETFKTQFANLGKVRPRRETQR